MWVVAPPPSPSLTFPKQSEIVTNNTPIIRAGHERVPFSAQQTKAWTMTSLHSFAQLVIGPPGSGKSTYCRGMKEFLSCMGRSVKIVNLDPANEDLPYECDIDISELITLQDAMEKLNLGPNGSLIYCMEFLEKNLEWLQGRLEKFRGHYFLFDCPGQVELYTHHSSVRNIAIQLQRWNFKVSSPSTVAIVSLGPRPFHRPVFDCFQYAMSEYATD